MSRIDHEWAIRQIDAFQRVTGQGVPDMSGSGITYFGTVQRGPDTEAESLANAGEQIVDRLSATNWTAAAINVEGKCWHLRGLALRAANCLQREEKMRQHLGDTAPEMDAVRLHP